MYIWEQPDWPKLTWQDATIAAPLAAVRHDQGRLIGRMEALGFKLREEAVLQTLTQDVVKTSEIEGEQLDASQVRSSLGGRDRQGAVLGTGRSAGAGAERTPDQGAQPSARRLRGQDDIVEMGHDCQVFAGHGEPGHRGTD